jgi:uncharacterized membrane protein
MDGLFSFLRVLARIMMVIRGISAYRDLRSGKAPRMSSREKKAAVVVVFVSLIFLAIALAIVFALDR